MSDGAKVALTIIGIVGVFGGGVGTCMRYWPEYRSWEQGMAGQAEFQRAEQNRKIRIESAKAEHQASKELADAEIARAKGAAEANKIMADSLSRPGVEAYLQWKWIHMLEMGVQHKVTDREVIYLPVDGKLPLLEAGRAVKQRVDLPRLNDLTPTQGNPSK